MGRREEILKKTIDEVQSLASLPLSHSIKAIDEASANKEYYRAALISFNLTSRLASLGSYFFSQWAKEEKSSCRDNMKPDEDD